MGKSILKSNTGDFWDNLLKYDELYCESDQIVKERIKRASNWIKKLKIEKTDSCVINIGSGQGYLEDANQSYVINSNLWVSMDISFQGLIKIRDTGDKGVSLVNSDALALPFINSVFDLIICMEVIEHFSRDIVNKLYLQFKNIGNKNAYYIFSVPIYEPTPLVNHPVGHFRKFTPELFIDELRSNDFIIIDSGSIYAFEKFSYLKSYISNIFKLRRPSVEMVLCKKS